MVETCWHSYLAKRSQKRGTRFLTTLIASLTNGSDGALFMPSDMGECEYPYSWYDFLPPAAGLRMAGRRSVERGSLGQRVGVGSRVRIFDGYGEVEFVIVPDDAARSATERRVSAESSLGAALLGRRVGEEVLVRTRTGMHFVRIRGVV
jgi:hypothetical protein